MPAAQALILLICRGAGPRRALIVGPKPLVARVDDGGSAVGVWPVMLGDVRGSAVTCTLRRAVRASLP